MNHRIDIMHPLVLSFIEQLCSSIITFFFVFLSGIGIDVLAVKLLLHSGLDAKNAYCWYYTILLFTAILCAIKVFCIRFNNKKESLRPRNSEYLKNQLKSNNINAPANSIDDLVKQICYGKNIKERKEVAELNEIKGGLTGRITEITDVINKFISNDSVGKHEQILIIEGRWGSGKTTAVLLAIEKANSHDRFIYESVFKYQSSGVDNFERELLRTLASVLEEQGIYVTDLVRQLIGNNDGNFFSIISNFIQNKNSFALTSDDIMRINQKTAKGNMPNIIIIIDDTDRLYGEEITSILSLLSILRRLNCVKIILPLDREVVVQSLEGSNVVQAKFYIEKYLYSGPVVKTLSKYELIEEMSLQKISAIFSSRNTSSSLAYCPVLTVIFLSIFNQKIDDYKNTPTREIPNCIREIRSVPTKIIGMKEIRGTIGTNAYVTISNEIGEEKEYVNKLHLLFERVKNDENVDLFYQSCLLVIFEMVRNNLTDLDISLRTVLTEINQNIAKIEKISISEENESKLFFDTFVALFPKPQEVY